MNPLALRAIGALILAALIFAGGYKTGSNAQAVADQAEFDRINKLLTAQKDEAAARLNAANAAIADRRLQIDKLTAKLGAQHEQNRQLTDRNRTALDALRLRWRAENPSARDSSGNTQADSGGAATGTETALCELPAALDRSYKAILFDADRLRDDYERQYHERREVTCY